MSVRSAWWVALAVVAGALVVGSAGLASAAGSGYDLSFSQAPSTAIRSAALIGITTYDPGGANLTVTLTLDGPFVLNTTSYEYSVDFGGGSQLNASAYALFGNNTTAGSYVSLEPSSAPAGVLLFSLSNSGTVLTFSIAKVAVGTSSGFIVNAFATATVGTTTASSALGSFYQNVGSCSGPLCPTSSGGGNPFEDWAVLLPIVVAVALVALVVVALRRRGSPPASGAPPPPPGPA